MKKDRRGRPSIGAPGEPGGDAVTLSPCHLVTLSSSSTGRGMRFTAAAVALCVVSALAATGLSYMLRPVAHQVQSDPPGPAARGLKIPPRLFHGWPKPDLGLFLSAAHHG